MTYLNHAGTSWPKPDAVREAVAAALEASPDSTAGLFEAARDEVCRFLGIRDPERFLFTSGCTAALELAFADLPWQSGDVVVTSALEHHALVRPLERLMRRNGVRHVVAPYRPGEPVDRDAVRATLREGGVRLVAMSHASNVTGEVLPAPEIAALAHEHDARFLLDAAQTVGVVPVDVAALGADIVTFAGHKGPQGPQGIGGFWAAPGVAFDSPAATCTIGAPGAAPPACVPFPGYCDVGSVNVAGAAGLAAGLRWLQDPERPEATGGHARRLAAALRAALADRPRCRVYGGRDATYTAVLSLEIEGLPLERAEAAFAEHGIVVRAGRHCAPLALTAIGAPAGTIRLSFGPTNDEADPERALAAIDALT